MRKKDYYQLLKVKKGATAEEIKKAYRKLALAFHPDINTDETAEHIFKAVSEAYTVLSDPEKRRCYDQTGRTDFSGAAGQKAHPFYRDSREQPCAGKCSGLDALFRRNAEYNRNKMGAQLKTKQSAWKGIE